MKGLLMMLKAFGLSDADIEKIRVFVPQVPTVAQNAIATANKAVADFDTRLKALEENQKAMQTQLTNLYLLVKETMYENTALVISRIQELENGIRSGQLQRTDHASGNGSGTVAGSDSRSTGAVAGSSGGSGRRRGNR